MGTDSNWWLSIIWQTIFSGLYFLVPIAGVSLNFYVLKKLGKIARLNGYRFETSSGIALFGMAIDLYVLHTTSAFSVWSWLVLSILRYTAVFFPFRYRTIWNQPRIALICLIAFTATFELWILFFVAYQPQQQSCSEASGTNHMIIQMAHLFDISVQYVLPAFIRIVLDGVVLFHKKTSMIKRSLIISVLNLCCNLPAHILRALWTIEAGERLLPERWLIFFEGVSQILYFSQFTSNALYLSHRQCEDHECEALKREAKVAEKPRVEIAPAPLVKVPKMHKDPQQQAMADKVAVMRLKSRNPCKIPPDEVIIVFVNLENEDRLPCMLSKKWTVNRCRTSIVEQCKLTNPTNLVLYHIVGESNELQPLNIEIMANT
ncbi:putative G-protein coupled receptor AH9.4 [Aphelenchoides besseyi]|nr:putative G-protein coupled receptor AH9.4 [Aphelenchoides besseyi]